jgi:recombination protein RecA
VAEFDIMYGTGISREGSLLDVGVELGFIKKSGAWFTYEGEQLGQGRENAKQFMRETPELMIEINEKIRSHLATLNLPAGAEVGVAANGDGDVDGATVNSDDLPISIKD